MLQVLLDILIYTLAAFGIIVLMVGVLKNIFNRFKVDNPKIRLVLVVKDQEDHIEGVIKSIFTKDILFGTMPGNRLVVLDMGSKDETLTILEKLKKDFEYIDILRVEEKEKIFSIIE
jgi:hypothetical protein